MNKVKIEGNALLVNGKTLLVIKQTIDGDEISDYYYRQFDKIFNFNNHGKELLIYGNFYDDYKEDYDKTVCLRYEYNKYNNSYSFLSCDIAIDIYDEHGDEYSESEEEIYQIDSSFRIKRYQ